MARYMSEKPLAHIALELGRARQSVHALAVRLGWLPAPPRETKCASGVTRYYGDIRIDWTPDEWRRLCEITDGRAS